MKINLRSIPIKVCVSILIIETILLTLMGAFYVQRFESEINQRVKEKLTLPSVLMSQRALNFDAVKEKKVIGELIQEDVVDTFITKRDGTVFFASDTNDEGKWVTDILVGDEMILLEWQENERQQLGYTDKEGRNFISSYTPILYADKLLGYLYIKINAQKIEDEKKDVLYLFIYGSILTIILTTLLEALIVHRLFVPRIRHISEILHRVEGGDLSSETSLHGPRDELRTLSQQVNRMIDSVAANISEISSTQNKLRESEERFRELSELLPEAIFEINLKGKFVYVNQRTTELFQYSKEEFYQRIRPFSLIDGLDKEGFQEIMQQRIDEKLKGVIEYTAKRKDGTIFPVHINSSVILKKGRPIGLRGILVDVSAEKQMQKQLLQAQKMEAMGRLAASISHEFGNPLIGVYWLLRDINGQDDLSKSTREMTGIALQECERMRDLLQDFRSFTKQTNDIVERFTINRVIENCLIFYKKYLQDRKVTIKKSYDREIPEIEAVKDQIHQVFVNLFMNAIESMDSSGGKLYIETAHFNNQVHVTIGDDGKGILAEDLHNIFEPFFSTKAGVEGMGLGLYVSYGIIKKHGGEIKVESQPGKGSSFTVILPIEKVHTVSEATILQH